MRSSKILAACFLGAPVLAMSATLTNSNIDTRTTTNVLSFNNLSFDNLSKQRADLMQFHGSVGDSGQFTITGPFGPNVAVSVVPGSGMSVSNQARDPSTGSISYTAAITGTAGLTISQFWTVSSSNSLVMGVSSNGLATLEFIGDNNGFLKTGGVFNYSVTLPGNWSTHGTATGNSHLIGLNSDFSIAKDFVFNSATNTTTLELLNTNYASGSLSVGLDFILYGSPVSEPMSPVLMLSGLVALACVGRRRRALQAVGCAA